MLDQEFRHYLDNQESFVKKYPGKFIVLKEKKVIGVYDSNAEAYTETIKNEEEGSFLIQHCLGSGSV